jgi:DNA invertase Pin-like site-specific DNA recombinase
MITSAVIYARSSPDCPLSAEDQIDRLKTVAADRGWTITRVFSDRPGLAKKGRAKRPGEIALLDAIRRGEVQKVLMIGLDRVGRSLTDLVTFLETCRAASISLWLDREKLDTDATNGLSLFEVAGLMAYHLRQSRRDRILRGQQAARSLDVKFGRPPLPTAKVEKAKVLLANGRGIRQVARMAGISAASVSRLKAGLSTVQPTA